MMNANDSKHRRLEWEELKLLVRPEVDSIGKYEFLTAQSERWARAWLSKQDKLVLSESDIRTVHGLAFGQVYEWAGKWRVPEQVRGFSGEVGYGRDGKNHGSRWKDVGRDLTILERETRRILEKEGVGAKGDAVAHFHAGFEKIHPFLDGNGRVGRAIMDQHTMWFFEREVSNRMSYTQYINCLQRAQLEKNYTPLRDLVLEHAGLREMAKVEEKLLQGQHQRGLSREPER